MIKELEGRTAAELSNAQVARFMELFEVAKIAKTKWENEAFNRLSAGHDVPGFKLAPKRANRVWKDAAAAAAQAEKEFGSLAFTEPGLKSPAQIEAMPKGKDFVAKYAHKPDTGLTVVPADDARPAVNKSNKSAFKPTKRGKAA